MWHILQKLEPLQEKLYNKLYATFESWVYWNQRYASVTLLFEKPLSPSCFYIWLHHTSCCYLGQKVKNKGQKEQREALVFPPKNPNILSSAHSFIFTDQESSTGCWQLLSPALAWTVVVMVLLMKSHWLGLQIVFIW